MSASIGPLRVLLYSPLAETDPLSGDTSYTESLLAYPPPGVEYTTYQEAIEEGSLWVRGRKPWHTRPNRIDASVFVLRSIEALFRKSRLMFREQLGYVTIEPGIFDVVHQHLPAIRQLGRPLPVVSGAGFPLTELYRERERWGELHLRIALVLKSLLARLTNAHNPWLRPIKGSLMTVYSDHFRDWLIARGVSADQVRISGTALPQLDLPAKRSDGHTLGVVARDLERKGGDIAIAAFRLLHESDPAWRLIVATTSANAAGIVDHPNLLVVADASRDTILAEVLPQIDILLAPTQADCGAPYGLLEALQSGTALVTSTIPWLDERLTGPAVRRVENSAQPVAVAVRDLARENKEDRQQAAISLWATRFSMAALQQHLRSAYDHVNRIAPARENHPPIADLEPRRILVIARSTHLASGSDDILIRRHRHVVETLAQAHHVTVVSVVPDGASSVALDLDGVTARRATANDDLVALVAAERPDVVVTLGPGPSPEYQPLWQRFPALHFYDVTPSVASAYTSSAKPARFVAIVKRRLLALAAPQPLTVVAASRREAHAAEGSFPAAASAYLPLSLDPQIWPTFDTTANGRSVLAVGNFAEVVDAERLVDVLTEIERRHLPDELVVDLVSASGVHELVKPFLERHQLRLVDVGGELYSLYRNSWAAIVTVEEVPSQVMGVLQAWSCGTPVVAPTKRRGRSPLVPARCWGGFRCAGNRRRPARGTPRPAGSREPRPKRIHCRASLFQR